MTVKTLVRHACARCGKKQAAASMVFSSYTGSRYCRDLVACAGRAKRAKKAAA